MNEKEGEEEMDKKEEFKKRRIRMTVFLLHFFEAM